MTGRLTRIALAFVFAGLLAAPLIYKRVSNSPTRASGDKTDASALSRYGLKFTESAKASGIQFVHRAPTLDAKLSHIMEQVASMGAAVSIVDFDHDGWQDIYVVNSGEDSHNALFRNLGNGTFRDVASEAGLGDVNSQGTGVSMGAVWVDYDNDGYEDVFLYKWGRPELFHNEGGKRFTPVGRAAGLPEWANINTAVWLDFDNDGKLDLFVGGDYADDVDLWHLKTTKVMPESFEYATNGGRKYLYRNLGDGKFEEVSA